MPDVSESEIDCGLTVALASRSIRWREHLAVKWSKKVHERGLLTLRSPRVQLELRCDRAAIKRDQ